MIFGTLAHRAETNQLSLPLAYPQTLSPRSCLPAVRAGAPSLGKMFFAGMWLPNLDSAKASDMIQR